MLSLEKFWFKFRFTMRYTIRRQYLATRRNYWNN